MHAYVSDACDNYTFISILKIVGLLSHLAIYTIKKYWHVGSPLVTRDHFGIDKGNKNSYVIL